ncbi:hypothetical protein BK133_08220 [Paenibacillus sp. FSL H8-0548]|nr:S-layer homology domain-containing protein [Paenibacillus sp. FSL H8-0548]OMF36894.1 hypothetical protein BK133_08220 [Paenibacillus sp. FSL H8-0548]
MAFLLVLSLLISLVAPSLGGDDVHGASAGMIANPGFETGDLTDWSVSDASKVSVVSSTYRSGSYALRINGDGSYPYARQLPIAVEKNTEYILSFYAKADAGGTSIEYRTASADSANTALKVTTKDNAPADWALYELSFNSGNYSEIRVVLKATKTAYFDDIQLAKFEPAPAAEVTVLPTDPNIKYFGRWDDRDAANYKTSWAGTYFKVNFTGTTVKLALGGSSNVYVRIDGKETYYSAANGFVDLTATPLAEGTHSLMVIAPYTDQNIQFRGLVLDEHATTALPEVGSKTIEFTGGSILAGYLLPKHALSDFAWLAPEMLGYEHTQIAYSGINLVDNWEGGSYVSNKVGLSKQFFKLKNAESSDTADWDFGRYEPDAVVINVGTNDKSFAVPSETYQAAYTAFLANIRAKYPHADIYAQRLFNGAYAAETLSAVEERKADGDDKVHYIDTTGWLSSSDYIDGTHPNEAAHQKLALRFAAILGYDESVKANHVSISGTPKVGETLNGSYQYANMNGNQEGGSAYRWLLSDSENGTYSPIIGETGTTLKLKRTFMNSFVKFEVTPRDEAGRTGAISISEPIQVTGSAAADSVFEHFITAQGDKLMDGEDVFRFASLNYPGGMRDSEFSQEDALRTLAEIGGSVTRTYIPPVKRYDNMNADYALILGPDASGVMQFNEAGFRKLDNLLALANEHGIRLLIPFVDQWQWEGGIESYVNFRYPGTISNDAANDEDAWKFYTDPQIISDFKQVIHYMMNRVNTITGVPYKEDKAILAWETGNELGGYNQDKFPQAWTTEVARYIKEEVRPEQLLLDGRFAVHPESISDANIDIVGNHFYTGNFIDKVNADQAMALGKKPYILGEFGLYTTAEPVDALFNAALKNGTDGIMIWSLRPHKEDGGFFWHDENPGNWASYHWPGFSSGDYYGETDIIRTVHKYAHYMKHDDVNKALPVPAIKAPANAPLLFPIISVADIKWQGSVGAAGYEVQRSEDQQNWVTVAGSFSDGGRAGTPSFHDENAISGTSYFYRVRGVNESGASAWSNTVTTAASHVITDELSLLYSDKEKRKVYAYDHSANVQTSSPDGNELGIGYKAFVSTAKAGYITYAAPVPLNKISVKQTGGGAVKWYVSATNSNFVEIQPVANGSVYTADQLPPNTRFVKFSIAGNNSVQIDQVQLEYTYAGIGHAAIPALERNGFIIDSSFTQLYDYKSANLAVVQGTQETEGLATLVQSDGNAGELVYKTNGDVNSYRVTAYTSGSEGIAFFASIDGVDYTPITPAVSKVQTSGGWSKVIYTDFALPAAARYIKSVYAAGTSGASPAIARVEIGYGINMIPLTDKPPANVFEDGEYDYGLDDNLKARYTRNPNGDDIAISLDSLNKKHGSYGLKLNYAFSNAYYAGLSRSLDGANLSSFDALHAWVKTDGSGNTLTFQIKTGDNRVWEGRTTMSGTTGTIEIKLSDFVQPQWNIEAYGAGAMNLNSVSEFAIIVSSGGGTSSNVGTVYVDDVKLANATKLDNFEGYGGYNALINKAFTRNSGGGSFDVSLDASHKSEGSYGLKVDYNFGGPGYAGGSFNPDFLNLKGYDGFSFWLQPDGANNELAIQFTDAAGKYWETKAVFKGMDPRLVYVPFDSFRFPSWYSSDQSARPDPNENITAFSLYVGGSPDSLASSGTLYIDDINGAKFKDRLASSSVSVDKSAATIAALPFTIKGTAAQADFVTIKAGLQVFHAPVQQDGTWTYMTSKLSNGTKEIIVSVELYDGTVLSSDSHTIEVAVPNNPYEDGTGPLLTNYALNPSFDEAVDASAWPVLPTHWKHTDANGGDITDGTVKLEATDVRTGAYRLVHWNASAFEVTTSQEVTGLADGIYELRAWTKNKGGQQAAEMLAAIDGQETRRISLPVGEGVWSYLKLSDLEVRNGKLTIGFHSKDLGGNWIAVEDVELVRLVDLSDPVIAVTDVTLNKQTLGLEVGESGQLNASVNPSNATNRDVIWSSSDEGVAAVDADGNVKGIAAGSAVITVTTVDGSKTASAAVTVSAPSATPTPTTVPSATPTPTTVPSATPTPTPTTAPSATPTSTPTTTPSATPASTPIPTPSATAAPDTGAPAAPAVPATPITVKDGIIMVHSAVEVDGKVVIRMTNEQLAEALKQNGSKPIGIVAAPISGMQEINIQIPVQQLVSDSNGASVQVDIGWATVLLSHSLLAKADGTASTYLELTVKKIAASALPGTASEQLASEAVYDFSLKLGGKEISEFNDGDVQVYLPYKLKADENPVKVVVYYVDANGKLTVVKNGLYSKEKAGLDFKPQHFSMYAVFYHSVSFGDLGKAAWAADAIEALAARDVIAGIGENRFNPDGKVTRAAFIQMLMNALDLNDRSKASSFGDVSQDAWYASAVASAQALGIVKGKADGNFGVHDPISRQEMAVILDRTVQLVGTGSQVSNTDLRFADRDAISEYAQEAVARIQAVGLMTGMEDGSFAPQAQATRAQAAVVIYRLFMQAR